MEAMEKNIKLDYKKKYKDLYQPKTTGMLIDIAAIPFLMVDGKGNPNEEDGDYSKAMQLLYGITFTIKMSRKGTKALEGYHDYVVPPLEGLWEMKGIKGMDYSRKEDFLWTCSAFRNMLQRMCSHGHVRSFIKSTRRQISTEYVWNGMRRGSAHKYCTRAPMMRNRHP